MRNGLISEMHRYRLVAVLRSKTAEEALATVNAVAEGGVKFIEITLTIPGAFGVIEALAKRSNLYVGAGTVLTDKHAQNAIAAGARFVVSPTLELNLIPICRGSGVGLHKRCRHPNGDRWRHTGRHRPCQILSR